MNSEMTFNLERELSNFRLRVGQDLEEDNLMDSGQFRDREQLGGVDRKAFEYRELNFVGDFV